MWSHCLIFGSLVALVTCQQRVAPGVPPQQYQAGNVQMQPPPPQQRQPPQGGYQVSPPGVNPQQYGQPQHYQPPPPPPPQQQQQQQQHFRQHTGYQQPAGGGVGTGAPVHQQPQQQLHQQPQQQLHQQPQQQLHQQPPQQAHHGGHQQPHHGHHQNQRVLHNPDLGKERDHIKDHLEVPLDTSGMSEQELQYHYFKMHDADNNNKLDGQELIKSLFHWHDASNHDGSTGQPVPEAKLFTDEELVSMIDPILDQDDNNRDGFIDYPEFVQAQRNAAAAAGAKAH